MNKLKGDIEVIKASGLFDSTWYASEYQDVVRLGLDPIEHYLRFGARLLRNPSPKFDTQSYLISYPDVAAAGLNPLAHYIMFGAKEGRAFMPTAINPKQHILDDRSFRNTAPGSVVSAQKAMGFRGFFDQLDDAVLSGWAIDESKPGSPVALSVYLDGAWLMDIKTSQPRNDLSAKGMKGDVAGFTLSIPSGLFPPGAIVDVRISKTGISLSKSPRQVERAKHTEFRQISTYLNAYRTGLVLPITVIVPIFNAFDAVSECLIAVTKHVSEQADVLLLDDCSTDPRITELLQSYARRSQFKIHRNAENLGYTRTVNKGISMCPERDILLLNSDTVVTDRWLENLRYCAYARAKVATVTALSDNAGAFSSPEIGVSNLLPAHLAPAQFARAIVHAGAGRLLEVPTGNGFCIFIRRAALDVIGHFNEEKFPRGYGEENDFCMRALRSGWLNLVCDKAYVFHKRSKSFQGEKAALMEIGARHVNTDYPEYRLLTQRFHDAEFSFVRYRSRAAVMKAPSHTTLQRILYVVSTQTGGTPQTNLDLMRAMKCRYHCFLLRCDSITITLSELVDGELHPIESHVLSCAIHPVTHRSEEYDRLVLDILYRYSIALVHIRHIGWHSLGLSQAAQSIGIPVVYSVHDFYSLCPSLNLVDNKNQYCGGRCTEGDGECNIELWPRTSLPPLKHRFVHRWRDMFKDFMESCDSLITTSPSAADIFGDIYPKARHRMTVIPHGRDFPQLIRNHQVPAPGEKVRVLVPGNISTAKGALLIKEMVELDAGSRFEFHFLGNTTHAIRGIGVHHGKYERSSFTDEVRAIEPHIGMVLSIWPETFCHTLTEMWSCGIPVFGMDFGAVADRIRAAGAGWLVRPGASAAEVLQQLTQAVDDSAGFEKRLQATCEWQITEGIWNDTGTMAMEYHAIYHKLLTRDRTYIPKRLGLVIKGETAHPATAHIRVLRPLVNAVADDFDARPVTVSWLLAGGLARLDALLVQRDAVPAEHVDRLIKSVQARGLPLIYEIDDLLWNLPEDHYDHAITEAQKTAMLKLAACAHIVTTTTPRLAEELAAVAARIEIIPNELDEALWLKPLSPEFVQDVGQRLDLMPDKPRLLYMGTNSHAPDLDVVAPAIESVRTKIADLEILQIGGGRLLPGAQRIEAPKKFSEYPDFVKWFRAISTYATAAIAPLQDNNFNAAKSDIKTLDYGLARIPAIFSAVGPYALAVHHEETGLLCENTRQAWSEAIMILLKDEALRERIREAAFERAKNRGLQQSKAAKWRDVLNQAFK